jgi:hypothetical protein
LGYTDFSSILFDFVKSATGIGRIAEVSVHILNLNVVKRLSTNCTTWEECFDEFSNKPVAAVYVWMNGTRVPLESPAVLCDMLTIEIEYQESSVVAESQES